VLAASLRGTPAAGRFTGKGSYAMLSWEDHLLQLAQWPNKGYHHTGAIRDEGPTTRWLKPGEKPAPYSEDRPTGGKSTTREPWHHVAWAREFARSRDMVVEGYLSNDRFFQRERVGRIEGDTIQLLRYTRYGITNKPSIPRRVRLVNLLFELDQPGEWYFDQVDQRLYAWPITDVARLRRAGAASLVLPRGWRLGRASPRRGGEPARADVLMLRPREGAAHAARRPSRALAPALGRRLQWAARSHHYSERP
jgi:hypothetical protein